MKYVIADTYAVIGTRPNFPYTKYGGYERPLCEFFFFNTQHIHSSIPIDPAILSEIGHRFIAKKKKTKKTKNADMRVWGDGLIETSVKDKK